jgi:hypothetical protein
MSPRLKSRLSCLIVPAIFGVLAGIGVYAQQVELLEAVLIAAFGGVMLLWAYEWGRDRRGSLSATLPFPLDCAVIPRSDSTAEELKELGAALSAWWRAECSAPGSAAERLDEDGLNDLLAGELPQPFGLRLLGWLREPGVRSGVRAGAPRLTAQDVAEVLRRAQDASPSVARRIPRAELRAVFIGLADRGGPALARTLLRLREYLPDDLVEDVVIDGQSWDEAP